MGDKTTGNTKGNQRFLRVNSASTDIAMSGINQMPVVAIDV
jgi:hypothetical protein